MKLNWGYSIIIFFMVFCSLMIAFMVFTFRQSNDLVTNDYYEKGADFTHQMETNSRSVIYKDSIRLSERNGFILAGFAKSVSQMADTMHIYFYRPSDKKLDFTISFSHPADSVKIVKSHLSKGHYTVKFNWLNNQKNYQVEKELFMEHN